MSENALFKGNQYSTNSRFLKSYIEKINTQLANLGWAFAFSPGIGKGFEFEGDVSFYIKD